MKKTLLLLPILFAAGCSSNTTSVDNSAVSAGANVAPAGTTAPDANGIPTPFVRDANSPGNTSSTRNNAAPSVAAPPIAEPKTNVSNAATNANASGGKEPQVPPGMAMGSSAVLPASPELDKKIAALQGGGNKKKLAEVLANRGTLRMNDPDAAPRVKYRAALQDYRAALKADATNAEAKANVKLIESIYTSMGRPIPQ